MTGKVINILITNQGQTTLDSVTSAEFIPGKGIKGDRYYLGNGTFSEKLGGLPDCEVTLIENEEIEAFNKATGFNYSSKDFRRNLVTEGVDLNSLVGEFFSIGEVQLKGIRLCEPCAHLASILGYEVIEHMIHKAGIRAQVIKKGNIHVADQVIS
jgi:MOSC domain-containing protein YiiM